MCLILGFEGKVVSLMPLSTPLAVGLFFPLSNILVIY